MHFCFQLQRFHIAHRLFRSDIGKVQHRNIIKLVFLADKRGKILQHGGKPSPERGFRGPVQRIDHPPGTILLRSAVDRFRDAVRVDKDPVAGIQLKLVFLIFHPVHCSQGDPVPVFDQFVSAAGTHDSRIFMPGIGAYRLPGLQVDNAQPDGDKHLRVVPFTEDTVCLGQHFRRAPAGFRQGPDRRLGPHHEQRCRDPFAGNIRNDQRNPVLIHKEEIVEVAADFPCGMHGGEDLKIAAGKDEILRQCGVLDRPGQLQLLLDPLFRRGNISLQCVHGLVDVVRKRRKFR